MQTINRQRSPELSVLLGMLEAFSVLGMVYCLLLLTGPQEISIPLSTNSLLVCVAWFAISAVSVYEILHWKRWGIYALGIATLVMTAVNLVERTATWGGASLGLLIAFIFVTYLRPIWRYFD